MHIPVLQKEVIEYLDPKPTQNFIDATFGSGGHSSAILENNAPEGKILGIDWDEQQIKSLKLKIKSLGVEDRITAVCENFTNLKEIVKKYNFQPVHGILFDLGMSSWHLEKSGRGFSFQKDEMLDMRYYIENQKCLTAEKIINTWSEEEIKRILREYGEERFSNKIARMIVQTREKNAIKSTFQLVKIIEKAVPNWYQRRRIHFATKTFMALRIAVNNELENIKMGLNAAFEVLNENGRIVTLCFHSLEDRICKNFFREKVRENKLEILTKKPVVPQETEIQKNIRARSAKLRAIIKIM